MLPLDKKCIIKCTLGKAMFLDEEQFNNFRNEIDKMVNITSRMLRRVELFFKYVINYIKLY
jgi:hypothetical protein